MPSFSQLITLPLLALAVNAATVAKPVPPGARGARYATAKAFSALDGTDTDAAAIAATVELVHQKSGASDTAPPNLPVPETNVTALDGKVLDPTSAVSAIASTQQPATRSLEKRILPGYDQVFAGTGTDLSSRDAAIEGTAFLTYSLVPNATYNVDACLTFCNSVPGCVFVNLYYEFNNFLLDFVFSEKSNLKCAAYADIHTAAEKTNFGGQQSIPPPAGLTYIQNSGGWAAQALVDPPAPAGYDLVFGPTNGANNAPGYMGFAFIDKYDVSACAMLCNTRGADPNGGACQYFNIWRAVVNGNPTTYTCSFYYIPTDASTAVNTGQGDLQVTLSRGYRRKSLVIDGGFEGYTCPNSADFCFAAKYANWIGTTPRGGNLDATIFHFEPYAHTGNSVALLGSANGLDALAGTLAPAKALATKAGTKYVITFFLSSDFSDPTLEKDAFVEVLWNNACVATIRPGFSSWTYHEFTVTARGSDKLAFHGGKAPAWSFIDDIFVFAL